MTNQELQAAIDSTMRHLQATKQGEPIYMSLQFHLGNLLSQQLLRANPSLPPPVAPV
jgi:hypothetical protein